MTIPALIMIGIGLSMDAAAITICDMMAYGKTCGNKKWLLPLFFGLFQGMMPLLGSLLGSLIADFVSRYSSIIMFLIFAVIGGKMIWDGLKKGEDEEAGGQMLIGAVAVQAVATSIDAFAVGVGFAAGGVNAVFASSIIAATTFGICAICLFLGESAARILKDKAQLAGGAIVCAIAVISLF